MRTTPNYGWPVAEPGDARRDYPSQVDGPRSDAIDAALHDLATNPELPVLGYTGTFMTLAFNSATWTTTAGSTITLDLSAGGVLDTVLWAWPLRVSDVPIQIALESGTAAACRFSVRGTTGSTLPNASLGNVRLLYMGTKA